MKTLVLRGRRIQENGRPTWHDLFPLQNALETIAKGKSFAKAGIWMQLAGELELTREDIEGFNENLPDFEIDVSNRLAKLLWKELVDLPSESFGRDGEAQPSIPPLGLLYHMFADIAECLDKDVSDYFDSDEEDD